MKKELKDYLHLYLGCDVYISKNDIIKALTPYIWNELELLGWLNDIKPILRPLSDMTEDEKEQIGFKAYEILRKDEFSHTKLTASSLGFVWAAKQTAFLLSKHFDLFGLIDSGLAIDKTILTLPSNG